VRSVRWRRRSSYGEACTVVQTDHSTNHLHQPHRAPWRRRPWGRRARPPAGGFRAGTHREHRSGRGLRGAFGPALGVTVGVGAAPTRAGQKRRAGRPKHGGTPAVDTRRLLGGRSTTRLRIPRVALAAAMMPGP
jgi:hypothetical protein